MTCTGIISVPFHNPQYKPFRNRHTTFLPLLLLVLLALAPIVPEAAAQNELKIISGSRSGNNWIYYRDAPNALYHHLYQEAFQLLDKREEDVSKLKSRSDWQNRRNDIRQKLTDVIGPFPEKAPLNPRIMRSIEKDFYTMEHIVFESQPGFIVTSSLFIPHGIQKPAPAILYASGHAAEGYRSDTYQHKILNLVKKGFLVFAFDPVSQGERIEYYNPETGKSMVGGATREHCYSGVQAFTIGSSLARHMIFDGIRAIDYLVTREEVDPHRIGMTGRSGGGTQTAYIAALDDRIVAAAPEAYISSFRRLLQTIGPQDAEQNLYHGLLHGLDHADYLAAFAPKPLLVITTTEDFFSIQGARETAAELTRMYDALGLPENFRMVEDGGGHTSTKKNREAMYAFFQKHLNNPGNPLEEEVENLSVEELQVTPTGQLYTSLGGETIFSLNRSEAAGLLSELQTGRNQADPSPAGQKQTGQSQPPKSQTGPNQTGQSQADRHFAAKVTAARELSGYREPTASGKPVFAGRIQRDGYTIEKYFLPGEGKYIIPYLLYVPEQANGQALLYLHPSGKTGHSSEHGDVVRFVENGFTVLAPDLIGTGEMGPGSLSNYRARVKHYEQVNFDVWFAAVMTGRSITGIRAGDTVRLARLLRDKMNIGSVYAAAEGGMGTVLLHAAAFEPAIERVALLQPYASYRSLVMNRYYDPNLHITIVPGALQEYDLPDLAGSLAPRPLFITGVNDASLTCSDTEGINMDNEVIRMAYDHKNASQNLSITTCESTGSDPVGSLLDQWLVQ